MTDARLQQRYGGARRPTPGPGHGTGRRPSKRTVIITAVVLLVCVLLVAVASFRPKNAPQTPKDVSYSEIDATRMSVTISAVPDAKRVTRCAVQAVSIEEAVVGYKEVDFTPVPRANQAHPVHKKVTLNTTQRAVSGQLDTCWFVVD